MAIKLIATDMDGTLLNDRKDLSKGALEAIRAANKLGVKVVLATGRPINGVKRYLDEIGIDGADEYILTYNGAFVQNLAEEPIIEHPLAFDDFLKMNYLASLHGVNIHFETLHHFYTPNLDLNKYLILESHLTNMPIRIRSEKQIPHNIVISKIMFTADEAVISQLEADFPKDFYEKYQVTRSEPFFLEINNNQASKGKSVAELARKLGIEANEVMVLGDQGNDLSMFEQEGFFKVAVGNAIDDLKNRADYISKTNEEGGFAHAVQKFVLDK